MSTRHYEKPSQFTVSFTIPDSAWMSANRDYGHHGWKKSLVDQLHEIAGWTAVAQHLDHLPDPCDIVWVIAYPKGVGPKADPDNAMPTCKALLDGLVQLDYLFDDDPRHVVRRTYMRDANLRVRHSHTVTLIATPAVTP